jgi:signal transduction histidine kinase
VGAVFAALLRAVVAERDSSTLATHSQLVLAAANRLERLVLDLETGERGFLVSGDDRFLEPWAAARKAYPVAAGELIELTVVPAQDRRARAIGRSVEAYEREYSIPLVAAAQRGDANARSASELGEGKRRVDAIRRQFDGLIAAERGLFASRDDRSQRDARRAVVLATSGLAASVLLIVLFGAYITRSIVQPVRRAARMAGRLAAGDLAVRTPETGAAEVGALERAFNAMGDSLERSASANAHSRAELAASRARVVAAADDTRRRIERDLHDGAQQRLVHTVITLKLARQSLGDADGPAVELVEEALDHAERATADLRDLAHGILPAALSRGGLRAGVGTLVGRMHLPLSLDVTGERFTPALEGTAYFIIAEALTNAIKHARAGHIDVTAIVDGDALRVEVRDDGIGGAPADGGGSGLVGLRDRAAALNGELRVDSPPGGGTVVAARLPLPTRRRAAGAEP